MVSLKIPFFSRGATRTNLPQISFLAEQVFYAFHLKLLKSLVFDHFSSKTTSQGQFYEKFRAWKLVQLIPKSNEASLSKEKN